MLAAIPRYPLPTVLAKGDSVRRAGGCQTRSLWIPKYLCDAHHGKKTPHPRGEGALGKEQQTFAEKMSQHNSQLLWSCTLQFP